MNLHSDKATITRTQVPHADRTKVTDRLFGTAFPFKLEPLVFHIASEQAPDYNGGYWEFFMLSSGGFYMAPVADRIFQMNCPNHFTGALFGDALGLMACLCAYSHLSFSHDITFAQTCADHFHWLRAYALEHPEAEAIFAAID